MFQFISVFFLHYLVQVLVRSAMNQYSFYIVLVILEYFSFSFNFSKRIAIILVLVFVLIMKIALPPCRSSQVVETVPNLQMLTEHGMHGQLDSFTSLPTSHKPPPFWEDMSQIFRWSKRLRPKRQGQKIQVRTFTTKMCVIHMIDNSFQTRGGCQDLRNGGPNQV